MNHRIGIFIILIIGILFSPGCEQIDKLCTGNDCFSFDEFSENLKTTFSGKSVGASFIIKHNLNTNNFWAEGDAVLNQSSFFTNTKMHIASITKSISAIAMMRAIDNNNNVNLNTLIVGFLPSSWTIGTNINTITFRELLTHSSGLRGTGHYTGCSSATLKNLVAAGVNLNDKTPDYENVNFGLMRYLIPAVDGFVPSSNITEDLEFALAYKSYVQTHIFNPLGINGSTDPADVTPMAAYYDVNNPNSGSWDGEGDLTAYAGAFGWQLSVGDVATIFSTLFTTNSILSQTLVDQMKNEQLGMFMWAGSQGTYYSHNGGWGSGSKGLNTVYMYFPKNKVTAVVFMNSAPSPSNKDMREHVQKAYDAAWGVF